MRNWLHDPSRSVPRGRRSIRLPGYDYAGAGAYFVTICTLGRHCTFGDLIDGAMCHNDAGAAVQSVWDDLPGRFPGLETDAFVVMPNHVHGIIFQSGDANSVIRTDIERLSNTASDDVDPTIRYADAERLSNTASDDPTIRCRGAASSAPTLGMVMRAFKSVSALDVNRRLNRSGALWQRNYYEHIIRNEDALHRIRQYILNNPMQWDLDRENPARSGTVSGPTSDEPWRV